MKTVPVENSVGMVLCHDITQITPGEFKGRAFKKGHIIQQEDIPKLLDLGKRQIFVWELREGFVHENDAAMRMAAAAAGPGISLSEPKEGKVSLSAQAAGLLKVNVAALNAINEVDQVMFATLHSNQRVAAGKTVAGTRIIPLVIEEDKIITYREHLPAALPGHRSKAIQSLQRRHCDHRQRNLLPPHRG